MSKFKWLYLENQICYTSCMTPFLKVCLFLKKIAYIIIYTYIIININKKKLLIYFCETRVHPLHLLRSYLIWQQTYILVKYPMNELFESFFFSLALTRINLCYLLNYNFPPILLCLLYNFHLFIADIILSLLDINFCSLLVHPYFIFFFPLFFIQFSFLCFNLVLNWCQCIIRFCFKPWIGRILHVFRRLFWVTCKLEILGVNSLLKYWLLCYILGRLQKVSIFDWIFFWDYKTKFFQ